MGLKMGFEARNNRNSLSQLSNFELFKFASRDHFRYRGATMYCRQYPVPGYFFCWTKRTVRGNTTSKASKILRQRTNALGGVPAGTVVEVRLLSLPPVVLGHLWPADRVVVSLRVCKQLRRDLVTQCKRMVLAQKAEAVVSESSISEDCRRLPATLMVTLRWKEKKNVLSLAGRWGSARRWVILT
eukprot:2278535-Rhodomonas_salina.1